jgi:hypothetical protein
MAGESLLADPGVRDILNRLKRAVEGSRQAMRDSGILKACMTCDREEGGSCCGAGLEDKYDGILLLINLLAGVPLPGKRQDSGSCLFLGSRGCLLLARHVICVNYLCRKITDGTPHEGLTALREREGEELNLLFRLHERTRRVLCE